MKKVLLTIILCTLATGCHYAAKMHGVAGSGVRKVEKRELSPFTSIATDGAFEIDVVCQQPQTLEIEGDDNLLPIVSTEVSKGVLRINNIGSYSTSKPMKIKITVPHIEGITANGAGTIEVSRLKNDKFDIIPMVRLQSGCPARPKSWRSMQTALVMSMLTNCARPELQWIRRA